jgi:membrane fusion protein (multidrug efflux system)
VDAEGKAQVRSVEVGDWQDDNWFVTKGLSAGDRVITDGLVRLAKGVPVKVVGQGTDEADQPAGDGSTAPDKAGTAGD